MANPKLSPEREAHIISLDGQGLSRRQIANKVGCSAGTVVNVLHKNPRGTTPELPGEVNVPIDARGDNGGETSVITPDKPLTLDQLAKLFKIDRKVWEPITFTANQWQGFYKCSVDSAEYVDEQNTKRTHRKAQHRKVALWQTRVTWKRIVGKAIENGIRAFVRKNIEPLPPRERPKLAGERNQLLVWGIYDAHIGMYAHGREVGEDMDVDRAVRRVRNSIDDMIDEVRSYPLGKMVLPIGNDWLHYDNHQQRTTFGDHHLDADGRFSRVYEAGLECLAYMVERAAEICPDVRVVHIPGNHDALSSYTLAVALGQRFRNDPRMKFDIGPNPRKYILHGGVLICFDHGNNATKQQLATIMPTESKGMWARSTWREIHIGHFHQRREQTFEGLTPLNGVIVRTAPALCSVDAYHHGRGLIGEPTKSVEAWRYDMRALKGSHVAVARD